MSDSAGPLEWKQRAPNWLETTQTHIDRRQAALHTSMPGTIVSFDPATMTATVQPSLQAFQVMTDGTRKAVNIGQITEVPVHFPSGGGHTLTFPVQAGDECLIIVSERSIDNWHQHGGNQQPSDWRMHDLNDAIVMVGLKSQPNVLGGSGSGKSLSSRSTGPPMSSKTVQIRSNDGVTVLEVDSAGQAIRTSAPNVVSGKSGGNLGFYGGSPVAKQAVTGSKQGNPALASLLHALASLNLIIDQTT